MTAWDDLDPTVIAVCGDWHGNQHYAKRAIEYAKEQGAEAILHVGDFGYDFHPKFLKHVEAALRDTDIPLAFAPGNHENYTYLNALEDEHGVTAIPIRPNIFYLPRTYRWTWRGRRFLAMGGAHSVDRPWRTPGREWWPDETITWQQAQKACDDGPADVMICHDVPAGVRIPCIDGNPHGFPQSEIYAADCHRRMLRGIVDQVTPSRLFAGHYHCRLTDTLNGGHYETVVNILNDDSSPVAENTTIVTV